MKTSFYFSHDYNARQDIKIRRMILKHGMAAYGVWWAIIEDLYNNANALQTDYECIAIDLRVDIELVKSVINDFDLFVIEGNYFGSMSVQNRLDERNERSKKAADSARVRWNKDANAMRTHSEGNAIKERKGKEKKKNDNGISIGQGSKTLKHQKEKRNTSARVSLDLSAVAAPLLDVVKEWIEYRKEIRKPMNIQRSFDAWYKKLCDYSKNDPKKARQIIDTSISNGWTGIFEPKDNSQSGYQKEEPSAPLSPLFNLNDVISTNLNKAPEER